jgi:hypothetical protein
MDNSGMLDEGGYELLLRGLQTEDTTPMISV